MFNKILKAYYKTFSHPFRNSNKAFVCFVTENGVDFFNMSDILPSSLCLVLSSEVQRLRC